MLKGNAVVRFAAALTLGIALLPGISPLRAGRLGINVLSAVDRRVNGYIEVHTFSVDSKGIEYGGDNQYGRTQKFVPKTDADPKLLIGEPWHAK